MDMRAFQVGLNLGGWISQYPAYDYDHFDTFIQEADLRRIADWGCDHVRLPVDYPVLELESEPGKINERGLDYVRKALDWCKENRLKVILDLHKAPGYGFDALQTSTLFADPKQQEHFLNLWAMLAGIFKDTRDFVALELLNEVFLPESSPWNRLSHQTVDVIRAVDPDQLLVIGGNFFNSASQLMHLGVFEDTHILYTFHFYDPMEVTHQKAAWVPPLLEYNRVVDYPGTAAELDKFVADHPQTAPYLGRHVGRYLDSSVLLEDVQPAIDFAEANHVAVYCGEFGVIETAPLQTRLNWTRDLISIFREHSIGRAYWSYKGVDFGLVDRTGKVVNKELVDIVCAH